MVGGGVDESKQDRRPARRRFFLGFLKNEFYVLAYVRKARTTTSFLEPNGLFSYACPYCTTKAIDKSRVRNEEAVTTDVR
jgi:hypothetical protein